MPSTLTLSRYLTLSPTKRLLIKLDAYGINSQLLSWLTYFLSNCSQYLYIGEDISHSIPVLLCVSQGSVLGSLLFLLYINDLLNCLHPSIGVRINSRNWIAMDFFQAKLYIFSKLNYIFTRAVMLFLATKRL